MTTKNLPPVLDRELGTLKQRVTDLERMLDRIRRRLAGPVQTDPLPFASYTGTGYSSAGLQATGSGWRHYKPANEITGTVTDPTRRITLDNDTFGDWTFRIDVEGTYQIGVTVTFDDLGNSGDRHLAITRITHEGITTTAEIHLLPAATNNRTTISGSALISAPAGSYWWASYGDDTGGTVAGSATSYWALGLSGVVVPSYVGSV